MEEANNLLEEVGRKRNAVAPFAERLLALCSGEEFKKARAEAQLKLKASLGVLITVDTLEEYDLDEERVECMRGMCKAMKRFANGPSYENVQLKCFLPAELKEQAFAENVVKYEAISIELSWSVRDLIHFVASRFASFLLDGQDPARGAEIKDAIEALEKRSLASNRDWEARSLGAVGAN